MKQLFAVLFLLLCFAPQVMAVDFNQEISAEDKAQFDGILEPVMKVYQFIKYTASVLAVLYLLFVGVSFVVNGKDQAKREQAKTMAIYVIVGLIVIWVAPLVVGFMIQ
jgi:uncharacterized membrane protein